MKDFDDKIKVALKDEFTSGPLEGGERIRDLVLETFRGTRRWLVILMWMKMIFFLAMVIVAGIQFFRVEDVRWMLACAVVFLMGIAGINGLFLIYWLEINKHSMTREIKRLELQIAELVERLDK